MTTITKEHLPRILEAALMASGQPLSIDQMLTLFFDDQQPSRDEIREALDEIATACERRGVELKQVSSGYRFQARQEYAEWISRLWEEKPPRYSRALLETLVLIAYRQPITRSEIEDVRGVSVSSHIVKTLLEREWVRVVGHRDVPGKPALYATTKQFLDYFNLKSLDELPTLQEIRDLDKINAELELDEPGAQAQAEEGESAQGAEALPDTEEQPAAEAADESDEAGSGDVIAETDHVDDAISAEDNFDEDALETEDAIDADDTVEADAVASDSVDTEDSETDHVDDAISAEDNIDEDALETESALDTEDTIDADDTVEADAVASDSVDTEDGANAHAESEEEDSEEMLYASSHHEADDDDAIDDKYADASSTRVIEEPEEAIEAISDSTATISPLKT